MERGIEVRWGRGDDAEAIGNLLEFDGSPRRDAEDGRFIIAEGDGRILAAVRVRATPSRMELWGFVADLRVKSDEVAEEVYRGAWGLARELAISEVWADDDHRESLLAAGYRRRIGGWRRDVTEGRHEGVLGKVFSLWARPAIPFFGRLGT